MFWKSILPLQQHLLLLMSNVFMQFSLRWRLEGHANKENFHLGNLCLRVRWDKVETAALEADAETFNTA